MQKPKRKAEPRRQELTAAALFSGCGGLDLGFQQAGFEIVFALDSDRHSAKSHRANFPSVRFEEAKIEDVPNTVFRSVGGVRSRPTDVLIGGPPCPPYSKSRFYRKDKPRGLDDEVGEKTIGGYLRALSVVRPRAFLLENVPGLAYDVHKDALDHILKAVKRLGYTAEGRVLNAADYGVPQIRERFFLVGMKNGERFKFPSPTHHNPSSGDLFSSALPPWRTAGDVLSDIDTEEELPGHFAGGQHHQLLRQVPPGDNYLFFTEKRNHPSPKFKWRSRYWSFLLKLSPSLPSWTIQARRSNNMGPFHWRNRILTIDEVKRLQTFPDEWVLSGTVEQQWRQLGNAVPPALARALAAALAEQL